MTQGQRQLRAQEAKLAPRAAPQAAHSTKAPPLHRSAVPGPWVEIPYPPLDSDSALQTPHSTRKRHRSHSPPSSGQHEEVRVSSSWGICRPNDQEGDSSHPSVGSAAPPSQEGLNGCRWGVRPWVYGLSEVSQGSQSQPLRPVTPPHRAVVSPRSAPLRSATRLHEEEPVLELLPPAQWSTSPAWRGAVASDTAAGVEEDAANFFSNDPEEANSGALPMTRSVEHERAAVPSTSVDLNEATETADPLDALGADVSGFLNTGNDCYACSVLTLLVRNTRFRKALLRALPPIPQRYFMAQLSAFKHIQDIDDFTFSNSQEADLETEVGRCRETQPVHHAFAVFIVEVQKRRALKAHAVRAQRGPISRLSQLRRLMAFVLRLPRGSGAEMDLTAYASSPAVKALRCGVPLGPLRDAVAPNGLFFSGYQEDAHEFLLFILDQLEQEGVRVLKEVRGADTCAGAVVWINELLQGRLLNMVRCRHAGCGHEIVTIESFVNLGLSLPVGPQRQETESEGTSLRVQDLLLDTLEFEPLEGYRCDRCQSATDQYQGACLFGRPPPLLAIQLKRFDATFNPTDGAVVMTKNRHPVDVSETIEALFLPDSAGPNRVCYDAESKTIRCPSDTAEKVEVVRATYRLQSMVQHHGMDIQHGHYTCAFARWTSSGPVWENADDKDVMPINTTALNRLLEGNRGCYLLLYEMEHEASQLVPLESVLPRVPPLSAPQDPPASENLGSGFL